MSRELGGDLLPSVPLAARVTAHSCAPKNRERVARALASGWCEWSHGQGESWARAEADALERIGMRAIVEADVSGGWIILARALAD